MCSGLLFSASPMSPMILSRLQGGQRRKRDSQTNDKEDTEMQLHSVPHPFNGLCVCVCVCVCAHFPKCILLLRIHSVCLCVCLFILHNYVCVCVCVCVY